MKQPVYYNQYDPRWAKIPYTVDGDANETISYSGCGPTSVAMVLATWHDNKIIPPDMCKLAIEMGDRTPNDGTAWSYFPHVAAKYGFQFEQTDSTGKAIEAIKSGALVVCSMGPGHFTRGGHFILAWGVDGSDNIYVNDPASTDRTSKPYPKGIFINECRQYFIFKQNVKAPEVKAHWAQQFYDYLKGIGVPLNETRFDSTVTRGELFAILSKYDKLKKGGK